MTPSRRQGTVLLVLLFAVAHTGYGSSPDELLLAQDGHTDYSIVVAEDASEQVKAVAEDFQGIFQEMTGASISLITDEEPIREQEVIIGPSKHLDKLAMYIAWEKLGEEGFVIRTHGPYLALFGGPLGGTRNAVYTFLDEHLGCRFYSPGFNVIPKRPELSIGILHVEKTPAFRARNLNAGCAAYPQWASRMRLNYFRRQIKYWVADDEKEGFSWGSFISNPLLAASFCYATSPELPQGHVNAAKLDGLHSLGPDQLVPASLANEHPEYFALRNGRHDDKRHPANGICPTSSGVFDVVVENANNWIRHSPHARIISISQADVYYACGCDRCIKEREKGKWTYTQARKPDGSPTCPAKNRWLPEAVQATGVFFDFVNRVADEIHKEFPDILVHTFAYYWTQYPPENWQPTHNLIVDFAPLQECGYHSLAQCEHNEHKYGYWTKLRLWTEKCPRVWIWRYATHHDRQPGPVLTHQDLYFQELALAGVDGAMVHMCGGSEQWLGELRSYIYGKLLWNPHYDIDAGIVEYCAHAYGRAAEPMLHYIRETQDAANYGPTIEKFASVSGYHHPGSGLGSHVTAEALQRWDKLLADAAAAVANDPASLARVRIQQRCHKQYMKSRELYSEAPGNNQ